MKRMCNPTMSGRLRFRARARSYWQKTHLGRRIRIPPVPSKLRRATLVMSIAYHRRPALTGRRILNLSRTTSRTSGLNARTDNRSGDPNPLRWEVSGQRERTAKHQLGENRRPPARS